MRCFHEARPNTAAKMRSTDTAVGNADCRAMAIVRILDRFEPQALQILQGKIFSGRIGLERAVCSQVQGAYAGEQNMIMGGHSQPPEKARARPVAGASR